jgi:hypothetical protein
LLDAVSYFEPIAFETDGALRVLVENDPIVITAGDALSFGGLQVGVKEAGLCLVQPHIHVPV